MNRVFYAGLIVAAGMAGSMAVAGGAMASSYSGSEETCTASGYQYGSSQYAYYYNCDGSGAKSSSSERTIENVNRAAVGSVLGSVGNHIGSVVGGRGAQTASLGEVSTGLAGGNGSPRFALWAAGGANALKISADSADFDGKLLNGTAGLDYRINNNLVIGFAAALDSTNGDTRFNAGDFSVQGYSVIPYAAYDFGQGTTVDVMVGYTYLDGETTRASGGLRGDYTGYRLMGAANVHHSLPIGPLTLRGDLGFTYAYSQNDDYTETGTGPGLGLLATHVNEASAHLGQSKVGLRASHAFGRFEPFLSTTYLYDHVADHSGRIGNEVGNDELIVATGVDFYATQTESVGLQASHSFLRNKTSDTGLLFNARLAF